jgi:hypothetical protein
LALAQDPAATKTQFNPLVPCARRPRKFPHNSLGRPELESVCVKGVAVGRASQIKSSMYYCMPLYGRCRTKLGGAPTRRQYAFSESFGHVADVYCSVPRLTPLLPIQVTRKSDTGCGQYYLSRISTVQGLIPTISYFGSKFD